MTLRQTAISFTLLAFSCPVFAQQFPTAIPESVGLSATGLERATDRLQEHVDSGHVAGVVAAVVKHGKLVYFKEIGERDLKTHSHAKEHTLPPLLDD